MKIGLTYNLFIDTTLSNEEPPPCSGEYDSPKTILAIENALKALGHTVVLIDADEDAYMNLYKLRNELDFVFNIAEGIPGESRESQIPIMLEMLGIPYTGCGPLSAAVTLDKAFGKKVLIGDNIPTPPYQVFNSADDSLDSSLSFPLMLKPNGEGSSLGIEKDSVCKDEVLFRRKLKQLFKKYKQSVLVEKFLSGREFTISLLGNGEDLRVLPIMEMAYERFPKMDFYIDCYEAKSIWCEENGLEEAVVAEDRIDSDLKKRLSKIAIDAFESLGLRDFGRIDLRMDEEDNIYVLEANPLPGLNPDPLHFSYFQVSARAAGLSYNNVIESILNVAMKRYRNQRPFSTTAASAVFVPITHKKITKNEIPLTVRKKT